MIKDQELLGSITKIRDTQKNTIPVVTVRYDVDGKNDKNKKTKFADENACALEMTSGRETVYKVKANKIGELFNPNKVGMLYNLQMLDRITNNPSFKFKEISPQGFEAYVAFLQTKKENLLSIAERNVRHGS